jgi:CubicO group peptidase (beta-lactamase class C family)
MSKFMRCFSASLLAVVVAASAHSPARAQTTAVVKAEEVGLSSQRLARIGDWLRSEITQKKIPGAVVIVARGGQLVYSAAVGQRDPAVLAPMDVNDIFRIYSMTKPIVSVAAMMLVEEGKLVLEAPVSRYIPEFANVKVGVEKSDPQGQKQLELIAPARAMTVQDLLRHTSGLTYGFFGQGLVRQAYRDANIGGADATNAEFVARLAKLPLSSQPGSTWEYSHSTDVLGRIIEVVSGQTLQQYLKQHLLDPLGMKDTTFYAPEPGRQARLAEPWPSDRMIGTVPMFDPRASAAWESAGGGLVSTAPEYARFLMMLRNGGELEGKRYISPATLAYMTSDHLGTAIARGSLYVPGSGYGFGLGFAVRTGAGEARFAGSTGDYFWGGAGGTSFWVDPKLDLFVVFMMQSPSQMTTYRAIIRSIVYGAILDATKHSNR